MGIERLVNLQERVEDLTEEIARKQLIEENCEREKHKLGMVINDIKNEAEKILTEAKWHSTLAASAENMINGSKVRKALKVRAHG